MLGEDDTHNQSEIDLTWVVDDDDDPQIIHSRMIDDVHGSVAVDITFWLSGNVTNFIPNFSKDLAS